MPERYCWKLFILVVACYCVTTVLATKGNVQSNFDALSLNFEVTARRANVNTVILKFYPKLLQTYHLENGYKDETKQYVICLLRDSSRVVCKILI